MVPGPAGRPLDLAIDPVGISDLARCRVEVVTDSGRVAWNGATSPQDGKLLAHVPRGFGPGIYWVRLYAPGDALLREFGLRLE